MGSPALLPLSVELLVSLGINGRASTNLFLSCLAIGVEDDNGDSVLDLGSLDLDLDDPTNCHVLVECEISETSILI